MLAFGLMSQSCATGHIDNNFKNVAILQIATHEALDLARKISKKRTLSWALKKDHLTTLMITHNMKDTLKFGNRSIMISDGKIIFDAGGEEKSKLTAEDLYKKFEEAEA